MRFGTSGIRGPWGDAVTPQLALALGRAVGHDHPRVVVARDARTSGPPLERALVAGLLDQGATAALAGIASTPALAHGARDHDAGIVLTASHNPPGDGGVKLWQPTGQAFDEPLRERVIALLTDPPPSRPWDQVGTTLPAPDLARQHVEAILDHVTARDLGLRVALDGGHGPAGHETAAILREMGCDVVTLHAQVDGTFPGRASEPTRANLQDLRRLLAQGGFDLGLAHDGDGDRLVALTAEAELVPGDQLLVLLARHLDARRVAVPVDASLVVDDALPDATVHRTPVGDVHVAEALARHDADLGGEASGSWILPGLSLAPDGPHAAARVAALAAQRPLRERLRELPATALERRTYPLPDDAKPHAMAALEPSLASLGDASSLDGVRVTTDAGWVLVRPSGTEPKLRLTAEARTRDALDPLLQEADAIVRRALKEVTP